VLRPFYRLADRVRHRIRLRTTLPAHAWGRRGEDLAHRYLQRHGCIVIARNYRTPTGSSEIDLIARDGDVFVFIEVKTRVSEEYGTPDSAVDAEKRRKIQRGAEDFLRRCGQTDARVRFDVVNVIFGDGEQVQHLPDAFRRERGI
jgi:putative endonuclease